jgi:hypothetical protein
MQLYLCHLPIEVSTVQNKTEFMSRGVKRAEIERGITIETAAVLDERAFVTCPLGSLPWRMASFQFLASLFRNISFRK